MSDRNVVDITKYLRNQASADASYESDTDNDEQSEEQSESEGFSGESNEADEPDISQLPFYKAFCFLPSGLIRSVVKQIASSVLVLLISVVFFVMYKTPQCLLGLVIAIFLAWLGVATIKDYQHGKIVEMALLCASIDNSSAKSIAQNRIKVVFRTDDEIPSYYQYFVPGRKSDMFIENHVYLLYTRKNNPGILLGWQAL